MLKRPNNVDNVTLRACNCKQLQTNVWLLDWLLGPTNMSPGYKDPSVPRFCVTPMSIFSDLFLNDVSCWREAFGFCRRILNSLPCIAAAVGSYCWVHVALNLCVLGFLWMLAGWLVWRRRESGGTLFATIVVYFKATSQLSCGWTEATGYQGTVVIRVARNFRASWYSNPLGEITMLGIFLLSKFM